MPVMRRAEIVDRKGKMELIVAEIVRLVQSRSQVSSSWCGVEPSDK